MGTGTAAVPAFEVRRSVRLSHVGDDLLARYVARGSERAFAALYERYHQQLYRYCRSIVRTDADAQDALQATFIRALAALREGRRNAPMRPWLFRIAHNEAVSILRHRRRDREGAVWTGPAAAASAEENVAERARWKALMSDIGRLPDRQRSALVLRELSGLSHDEIAVALDTTAGGAKQAIFEARQALSELEEGRAMSCDDVRRRLSDGDRRVVRGRRVASHLRACSGCAAFAAAMSTRRTELRAFMPLLPPAMAGALLTRSIHAASIQGGGGIAASGTAASGAAAAGGAASGAAATGGAVAGGTASIGTAAAGTAIATKAIATAVVVATAAAGATGLSGVLSGHHARVGGSASHRGDRPSASAGASGGSAPVSAGGGAGARAAFRRPAAGSSGAASPAAGAYAHGAKQSQTANAHGRGEASQAGGGPSHAGSGSAGPGVAGRPATGHPYRPPSTSSGPSGTPADPVPGGGQGNGGGGSSGSNGSTHSSGAGSSGVPQLPVTTGGNSGAHTPGGVNGSVHAHQ